MTCDTHVSPFAVGVFSNADVVDTVAPVPDVRSKGTNFQGLLTTLERLRGRESVERVLAAVRGEAGDALRHGAVVSGGWYPVAWHDALLLAVEESFPSERLVVRDLTRAAVAHDFKTLFKIVSLVATPEFSMTNATKVMARYYDGGKVTVVEAREGLVHFRFDDYQGFTRRIWDDVHGGLEAVVDLLGVQRMPFDVRGGTASRAEFFVHFKRA